MPCRARRPPAARAAPRKRRATRSHPRVTPAIVAGMDNEGGSHIVAAPAGQIRDGDQSEDPPARRLPNEIKSLDRNATARSAWACRFEEAKSRLVSTCRSMSACPTLRTQVGHTREVREVPILLQKSAISTAKRLTRFFEAHVARMLRWEPTLTQWH